MPGRFATFCGWPSPALRRSFRPSNCTNFGEARQERHARKRSTCAAKDASNWLRPDMANLPKAPETPNLRFAPAQNTACTAEDYRRLQKITKVTEDYEGHRRLQKITEGHEDHGHAYKRAIFVIFLGTLEDCAQSSTGARKIARVTSRSYQFPIPCSVTPNP